MKSSGRKENQDNNSTFSVTGKELPGQALNDVIEEISNSENSNNRAEETPDSTTALPLIVLSDVVIFPGMTIPVPLNDEESVKVAIAASNTKTTAVIATIPDLHGKRPTMKQLRNTAVLAHIVKVIELPDGGTNALVQSSGPVTITRIAKRKPFMQVETAPIQTTFPDDNDTEMGVIVESLFSAYNEMLSIIDDSEVKPVKRAFEALDHPVAKMNFISINSPLDIKEKIDLLNIHDIKTRAEKMLKQLKTAVELMKIKADVAQRTSQRLTQQQREHFLRSQINIMQDELGGGSIEEEEMDELDARALKKVWKPEVGEHFAKEMRKLERFNASSPEYGIQYGYLETMLNLPWEVYSEDNFQLDHIAAELEKDHYGLEKVKERIIEQMAVMKLRNDMRAPILCLYGPPGVGKTSLGKSIASAIGRQYARVALGGVHDEAEIRGHRRTYVGAMPGRIISALLKVGTGNPVFVLDEIDKIGKDIKGDPSTALLEVLDPEQNSKFHDNYLDIDYDLSKVLFIATANSLENISRPLRDRMEIIEIPGYVNEEKVAIAALHLVPKLLTEHGLEEGSISFPAETLAFIIDRYTRESGVRLLEKKLAKIIRKLAVKKASNQEFPSTVLIEDAREYLGHEEVDPDQYEDNSYAGVVTGLAWTAVGGEILFVETSLSKGKGEKLVLTGNLGDVMKESAAIALQYLKAHAPQIGIAEELFGKYDIHIHVPEGAIPKDGPSAGITMATALASSFTRRKVKPRLAMTGEITLRGKVLPVGGIKEKILAAKRAGINTIIMCDKNKKDIEAIKPEYLEGLSFIYVNDIMEVLNHALTDEIDENLPER